MGVGSTAGPIRPHRLTWTGEGVSASASFYTASTAVGSLGGGGFGYRPGITCFTDGRQLMSVSAGRSSADLVMALPAYQNASVPGTAGYITVALSAQASCPTALECVTLMSTTAPGAAVATRHVEGTAMQSPVVVAKRHDRDMLILVVPRSDGAQDVVQIDVATGARTTILRNVLYVGPVVRANRRSASTMTDVTAVLFCEPASASGSCAGRPLRQRQLDSDTVTELGLLPTTLSSNPSVAVTEGQTSAVNFTGAALFSELYILTPGVANSLKFVARQPGAPPSPSRRRAQARLPGAFRRAASAVHCVVQVALTARSGGPISACRAPRRAPAPPRRPRHPV
jgi:hypothetical protein